MLFDLIFHKVISLCAILDVFLMFLKDLACELIDVHAEELASTRTRVEISGELVPKALRN